MSGRVTTKAKIGIDVGWIVFDPESGVWALDATPPTLLHIDSQSGRVVERIALHHLPHRVTAGHDRIWVSLASP